MRKIYVILFLFIVSIFCIATHVKNVRNDYYGAMEKIETFKDVGFTEAILEQHWENDTAYPLYFTPDSIFHLKADYSELSGEEISAIEDKMFIDVLSKRKEYLLYVPVGNDGLACGYLLLSSGVDGKLDNKAHVKYKSMDDAIKNLNLYTDSKFSYFDYLFGNKDLLILKVDRCIR